MAAQDRPPSVGELVVRNGKQAGAVVPLVLPVTVIGRGAGCDVKLAAASVADLHCLVTVTPAGPVLRSWQPDHTLLNGEPTAAALLSDGDDLKVGPCEFEFHWRGAEAKQPLTPDLLAQVAEVREAFRDERDREAAKLVEARAELEKRTERVQKLREQAREERAKARRTYQRFLKRMKARWSGERVAVEAAREQAAKATAAHAATSERFEADRERWAGQIGEVKERLHDAWELLAENQKRLLADRQRAEAWVTTQTEALDRRTRELTDREQKLQGNRTALEGRASALAAEIAGLESRAVHARNVLKQLDEQRSQSATPAAVEAALSLESPRFHPAVSQEAERLLTELNANTQAAARERTKLAAAREEMARQAADLADQRAVLAEQVAALAAARAVWQSSEHGTVLELEGLAEAVRGREQAVEERERELTAAERERRQREYDLWQLRVKLEGWQAALAAHEASAAADRDRAAAELDAKQTHLVHWEESLAGVQQAWSAVREQQHAHLLNEIDCWGGVRERYAAAVADAERARAAFRDEAEKLATQTLTREEQAGAEPRRVRVIRKRWESHFAQFRTALEGRHAALADELRQAEERVRHLHQQSMALFADQTARTDRRLTTDRADLTATRTRDEHELELSALRAHRERSEQEARHLRAKVDELNDLLHSQTLPFDDGEPDVIPLVRTAA